MVLTIRGLRKKTGSIITSKSIIKSLKAHAHAQIQAQAYKILVMLAKNIQKLVKVIKQ